MAQSFYPIASDCIDAALRVCGAFDPEGGVTPSTTQRTNALQALNFMVTAWQADGMQVWCQKTGTYVLANAVNNPTIGPGGTINVARPMSIQQAWLRDTTVTTNIDIPVVIIGREEYNLLSSKATTGVPNVLFYDPEYDLPGANSGVNAKGRIYLWPTPDTAVATQYDLYFVYTRPIQDFSVVGDSLDFPQEWLNAVKWGLALQLAPEYNVPIMTWDRLKAMAEESKRIAMAWDTERPSVSVSPATENNA